jgi:hypothetical protein
MILFFVDGVIVFYFLLIYRVLVSQIFNQLQCLVFTVIFEGSLLRKLSFNQDDTALLFD